MAARARAKLTRLLGLQDNLDTAARVHAFVLATDIEEGSSEWRSSIDVSDVLAKAVVLDDVRDHMRAEHAAYHERAAIREYADHCRSLQTSPCRDVPGWSNSIADAGWQSHERWQQLWHRGSAEYTVAKRSRFSGHDSLSVDEAFLVATALVDPMCPYLLFAFAATCREFYHISQPLLEALRKQFREVLTLCDDKTRGVISIRPLDPRLELRRVRMLPKLKLASDENWPPSLARVFRSRFSYSECDTSALVGGSRYGASAGLLEMLRTLVGCKLWWSTLTSIDVTDVLYRLDLGFTAAILSELASAIAAATSLREVTLAEANGLNAEAQVKASAAASEAREAARACAALEAATPEQGGTLEYQRWQERCSDAREKCQAAEAAAASAAAYAKLEQAIVDAEQAVIQACRGRRIKVSRKDSFGD